MPDEQHECPLTPPELLEAGSLDFVAINEWLIENVFKASGPRGLVGKRARLSALIQDKLYDYVSMPDDEPDDEPETQSPECAGAASTRFCEKIEAEGLDLVGHFYVPEGDEKLQGMLDGRISFGDPEVDTFLRMVSNNFNRAVKRLIGADPRIICFLKMKEEGETDGEYLSRRRIEAEAKLSASRSSSSSEGGTSSKGWLSLEKKGKASWKASRWR